jgi:hypothetical protein
MILDAITCIALAVYHEAGSDYVPDLDKHSVAHTVENRSGNRNQNHCEVITARRLGSQTQLSRDSQDCRQVSFLNPAFRAGYGM